MLVITRGYTSTIAAHPEPASPFSETDATWPKHIIFQFGQLCVPQILGFRITGPNRNPHLGMSENVVYPFLPNGFADHYPY